MPVDAAGPAEEPEAEAQSEPATPVTIAPADIIAAPDEDEEEDSDADDSAAPARPIAVAAQATPPPAPAKAAASADGDRWAGTMSREWNENEKPATTDLPEVATKPKPKAKPRITVEQAVEKIPADALKYIRENFKTDVQHVRAYAPTRTAKS
jgi:hypothetical protein